LSRNSESSRLLRPLLVLLGGLLAAVWLASRFLTVGWVVAGPSMAPTLAPGDRVCIDIWTYRQRDPRPGEIVLVTGPDGTPLVKRVVTPPPGVRVPPGSLWLVGDNRAASRDSRQFGPLPRSSVRGRVAWRYWPPRRTGVPR
jgi:nickel-type superoxide dismutase maturation protease